MKKYKQLTRATVSDLRIETSEFESNSGCPKNGRGQVDDLTGIQVKDKWDGGGDLCQHLRSQKRG